MVDGVALTFLAPDSAWTAGLRDPNLASAVMRARFGHVRVLLTGDAEAPEEEWLLSHARGELRAEVLKVAHHGSATSSGSAFLDAVAPTSQPTFTISPSYEDFETHYAGVSA